MIFKAVDDMQSMKIKSEELFTKIADKALLNFEDVKKSITEVKSSIASLGEELKTLAFTVNENLSQSGSTKNLDDALKRISDPEKIAGDYNKNVISSVVYTQ